MRSPNRLHDRPRIAVFSPSIRNGDAVGIDAVRMRDALDEAGWSARLFVACPGNGGGRADYYRGRMGDFLGNDGTLVYHHAVYFDEAKDVLAECRGRRVLRHHSVTPGEFFTGVDGTYRDNLDRGTAQTRELVADGFDLYLPTSSFVREELFACGARPEQCRIVRPLHRVDRLEGLPSDDPFGRFFPRNKRNILVVGRLVPNKNQEFLLRAFAHLRSQMEIPARLVFVGAEDPHLPHWLMQLKQTTAELGVGDDVVFAGRISDARLATLYRRADLLMCGSLHEGFCVPLVEAMAFRVPVVALDAGAVAETVGDGGFVLAEADVAEYARVAGAVLADERLREFIAQAGRCRYDRVFSPARQREEVADVLAPGRFRAKKIVRRAGTSRQTGIGLIGFNDATGLGSLHRDLARFLPVTRWLVVKRRFAQLAPPKIEHFESGNPPTADEIDRFVAPLRWLLFCERPMHPRQLAIARSHGVRIAFVPMWEFLSPEDSWLRDVDLFLCPTEACLALLTSWKKHLKLAGRLEYVPWPLDVARFKYRTRDVCRSFLYCDGTGGCSARLDGGSVSGPRKGLDIVSETARLVPDIPIVVRTQWLSPGLKRLPENITVIGPEAANEDLYGLGDVAIQPSRWEGLGLQLLECQAAGMPLVTTDAPPMNEFQPICEVPSRRYRATPCSGARKMTVCEVVPEALAAVMEALHGRPIAEESRRAREFVERTHAWDTAAPRLKHLLATAD